MQLIYTYIKIHYCSIGSSTTSPVNCQWSNWSASGSCSKSCDGGRQKYTRYKTVSESNGGSCTGSDEKYNTCNSKACPGKFLAITFLQIGSLFLCLVNNQ